MSTLADLHRAVQATLASKRLGQPVFVRYLWHSLDKPEVVLPRLTQLATTVRDWLGQPPERVYAIGQVAGGQISLTLEFREGASALLCWSRSPAAGAGVDLLVIGNRGALYHDAGSAELWEDDATFAGAPPDALLRAAIEQTLHSGQPEAVGGKRP